MPTDQQKKERADRARANGARSKGATTPEGQMRARTASLQHGLYADAETLSHTVDPVRFSQLRDDYLAIWQPVNRYIAGKIDDLANRRFHLDRLKSVHAHYMNEIYREFSGAVQEIELFVSAKENILMRLETRIRQAEAAMSRLERDIIRLQKHFATEGPSQKSLKTNANASLPQVPPCRPYPVVGNVPLAMAQIPALQEQIGGPEAPEMSDTAPRT